MSKKIIRYGPEKKERILGLSINSWDFFQRRLVAMSKENNFKCFIYYKSLNRFEGLTWLKIAWFDFYQKLTKMHGFEIIFLMGNIMCMEEPNEYLIIEKKCYVLLIF